VQVHIITPEKTVLESDDVEHVILPAQDGELGILPGHIAMIAGLSVGMAQVDLPGESVRVAVSGGFAEVLADRVLVLADAAERAEDVDVARARAALRRARERLASRDAAVDAARAQAALMRAMNRLKVAGQPPE